MNFLQKSILVFVAVILACFLIGSCLPPREAVSFTVLQPIDLIEIPKHVDKNPQVNPLITPDETIMPDTYGNIMCQFGSQLWSNNAPTANAIRIRDAYLAYGQPKWVILSNLANENAGTAYNTMPEALIQWFHAAGVKCMIWCHTYDSTAHTYFSYSQLKAQVDAQITWGPSIDGINFDECSTASAPATITLTYVNAIVDYVHSKGKISSINTGERDIPDAFCVKPDMIMMEGSWWAFSQYGGNGQTDMYTHAIDLCATYPTKFWGITSDWYVEYYLNNAAWIIPADSYQPIDLAEAVRLTRLAWNNGIYNFQVAWGNYFEEFPEWWEDYLAAIMQAPEGTGDHTVTVEETTGGSTSLPADDYEYVEGDEVQIEATPDDGYVFVNWEKDDVETELNNPAVVTVTESATYTPTFAVQGSILIDLLDDIEKENFGKYVFAPGVAEPGLDNYQCSLRSILDSIEG